MDEPIRSLMERIMNLIKLYFTAAAIIVVAICTDPVLPDAQNSAVTQPVPRTDNGLGQLTQYRE
jgi:hypothetical protein